MVRSVVRLGEGTDHVAYEVDRELIVRFATGTDPAERAGQVRTEARVLAAVAAPSSPAVPEPLLVVEDEGVLVYRKLPGTPLLDRRAGLAHLDLARFGAVVGGFLTRLHRAPVSTFEAFAPREEPALAEWLAAARQDHERVVDRVPGARRAAVEAFLAGPPPEGPPVAAFCHNDLGTEHVLVDPAALLVTGVIDWADAAITDPACDLARIHRDLGAEALAHVLDHYDGAAEPVDDLRRRAEFYARCSVFEEVAYGLLPGHEAYFAQGLSALRRLFRRRSGRAPSGRRRPYGAGPGVDSRPGGC